MYRGYRDEQPDLDNRHRYVPHWIYDTADEPIYLGNYHDEGTAGEDGTTLYYEATITSGGDYSGSMVEKSNYEALKEYQEKLPERAMLNIGGYPGGYGWLFRADVLLAPEHSDPTWDDDGHFIEDTYYDAVYSNVAGEVRDILYHSEDYMVIDEDLMSKLEMEDSFETWKSCRMGQDFIEAVRNLEIDEASKGYLPCSEEPTYDDPPTPLADALEELDHDEALFAVFEDAARDGNTYWEDQGSGQGMWIRVEEVAKDYYVLKTTPPQTPVCVQCGSSGPEECCKLFA